jgi:hypothetical protein
MHTTRINANLLRFSVLLTFVGCGGDDDAGPPPVGAVEVEEFCAATADAVCARAATCACFGPMGPPMECAATVAAACPAAEGTPLRDEIAAGAWTWDADAAGRLLAALHDAPCPETPCPAATCVGLSASGGACDGERLGCPAEDSCIDGRCVTPAADGAPCTVPAGCASERCEGEVCMPKRDLGDACADDGECITGHCDFSTGRCAPLVANDELCTESADCESGYCDRDLKLGAGSCQPLRADGEACDEDIACAGGLCADSACGSRWCVQLEG